MLLTSAVYPLTCFGIGFVLNTIAIFQRSLAAVPFGTMVVRMPRCTPVDSCRSRSLECAEFYSLANAGTRSHPPDSVRLLHG